MKLFYIYVALPFILAELCFHRLVAFFFWGGGGGGGAGSVEIGSDFADDRKRHKT